MDYVAISGPIHSGKSETTNRLAAQGYMVIEFSDLLKRFAIKALNSAGKYTTLHDLKVHKEKYRAFLQAYGTVLDFDNDPDWIAIALGPWYKAGCPKAVFDCVRTPAQANHLRGYGFDLVYLNLYEWEQVKRAKRLGSNEAALRKAMRHPIERNGEALARNAALILNTSLLKPDEVVEEIIGYQQQRQQPGEAA